MLLNLHSYQWKCPYQKARRATVTTATGKKQKRVESIRIESAFACRPTGCSTLLLLSCKRQTHSWCHSQRTPYIENRLNMLDIMYACIFNKFTTTSFFHMLTKRTTSVCNPFRGSQKKVIQTISSMDLYCTLFE